MYKYFLEYCNMTVQPHSEGRYLSHSCHLISWLTKNPHIVVDAGKINDTVECCGLWNCKDGKTALTYIEKVALVLGMAITHKNDTLGKIARQRQEQCYDNT